jgi:hypothetical protein
MLDITKHIQSLTSVRRRSGDFMKQLKKSKRPVVLTVNGKGGGYRAGCRWPLSACSTSPRVPTQRKANVRVWRM